MKRKVSVVMSVYSEPIEVLSQAMNSLINQTFEDYEIIVVLDDPSNKSVKEYLKTMAKNYSFIHLFINEYNLGQTASLNKGINLSNGLYICRMDADDVAYPNRLEIQYAYAIEHKYKFVVSPVMLIDQNGNEMGNTEHIKNMTDKQRRSVMKNANLFAHPTFFIEKEFLISIGSYNEEYRLAQDYDLIVRALKHVDIGVTNQCTVKYRVWGDNVSHKKDALQKYTMLQIQTREKNGVLEKFEKFSVVYERYRIYKWSLKGILFTILGMLQSSAFRIYMLNFLSFKIKNRIYGRGK